MIALLSEALCFKIYLSLYLHRIFKFYFFLLLTFTFSSNYCLWVNKHTFGYLNKTIKFNKSFADVRIPKKIPNLIISMASAAHNLTVSRQIRLFSD